jgi:hypothetical protein
MKQADNDILRIIVVSAMQSSTQLIQHQISALLLTRQWSGSYKYQSSACTSIDSDHMHPLNNLSRKLWTYYNNSLTQT